LKLLLNEVGVISTVESELMKSQYKGVFEIIYIKSSKLQGN